MKTLRDEVKDAIIKEYKHFGDNIDNGLICDMADTIFETLGIKSADQDKVGAKVCVNPKILITINGGLAEVCGYHPSDMDISIRDYDIQGECESPEELESLPENEYGGKYIERFVKL